ncbi:hypothetical protein CONPUDRAFT_169669 [Coniophora puteana RWD-64-598 SS2]|uniref:Uncharacterized protein n=1 Tax=Coniophora puteana (strain RWD-64-598) TaxID=741705 RepID=A0A5M3M9D9_CONPW|nr:uncharacterized protein CONPUDRAFT_169669 [Coniophora puteana RWD-64-598 SS2]EIW75305.1 hypothetical protein CONPUDRAFT_169669 [Coniophora puteana RWD-64-598 SS2]
MAAATYSYTYPSVPSRNRFSYYKEQLRPAFLPTTTPEPYSSSGPHRALGISSNVSYVPSAITTASTSVNGRSGDLMSTPAIACVLPPELVTRALELEEARKHHSRAVSPPLDFSTLPHAKSARTTPLGYAYSPTLRRTLRLPQTEWASSRRKPTMQSLVSRNVRANDTSHEYSSRALSSCKRKRISEDEEDASSSSSAPSSPHSSQSTRTSSRVCKSLSSCTSGSSSRTSPLARQSAFSKEVTVNKLTVGASTAKGRKATGGSSSKPSVKGKNSKKKPTKRTSTPRKSRIIRPAVKISATQSSAIQSRKRKAPACRVDPTLPLRKRARLDPGLEASPTTVDAGSEKENGLSSAKEVPDTSMSGSIPVAFLRRSGRRRVPTDKTSLNAE